MFLTITSLIVAAMFGVAFASALRLSNQNDKQRKRIKDLNNRLNDRTRQANELNEMFESLADANESEDVTYFVGYRNNSAIVLRRAFVKGREYHTFVKSFNDEDAEFNQREAEELCEILNS